MSSAAGDQSRKKLANHFSRRAAPTISRRPDPAATGVDYVNGKAPSAAPATPLPLTPTETEPSGTKTVKSLRLTRSLTVPDWVTVAETCRRMKARRADAALLTDSSNQLSGIITAEDVSGRVVAQGLRPDHTIVSRVMTRNPVFVKSDTLALDALQTMVEGKFRHLPVVENNEVIGMLDIKKFLFDVISIMEKVAKKGNEIADAMEGVERHLKSELPVASHALVETVRDNLFKPPLSSVITEDTNVPMVSPSDPIILAAKKMRESKVNSVIVMSGDALIGIVTSKDILLQVVAQNMAPELTTVDKVMTENPDIATLDTPILDALHMMQEGKFLHVPVADRVGHIIACLDVLQLSKAAISIKGGDSAAMDDMVNTILQKFYDSFISSNPADEEPDDSEASMPMEFGERAFTYPPQVSNAFFFKIEDNIGRIHRFSCVSESLDDLHSVVAERLELGHDEKCKTLLYEDDEGDKVLLTTDSDLSAALCHARSTGRKVLKLYIDDSSGRTNTTRSSTKKKRDSLPALKLGVVAGAVVVASISIYIYWRRSRQ